MSCYFDDIVNSTNYAHVEYFTRLENESWEKRESKCGQTAIANFVTVGKGRTELQGQRSFSQ